MANELLGIGIPTLAVLIGILVNNSRLNDLNNRLSDLRVSIDRRFDDLNAVMDARFAQQTEALRRVEEVMDARLSRIEQELHLK